MSLLRKATLLTLALLCCGITMAQSSRSAGRGGRTLREQRKAEAEMSQLSTEKALMRYAGNVYQFGQIFPQEKVYIQFDNTSYYTGETIWFKAFVVEASTHHRAPSKVLYVDLLSPTGVVLKQQKLKVVAGQADGSFPLIDGSTDYARDLRGTVLAYPSGFYEVRAYTANMQNFSEEGIFSRVLPVFEKPEQDGNYYGEAPIIKNHYNQEAKVEQFRPETESAAANSIKASFYPEGGNLVQGLPCRVAFQITGNDGFGIDAEGVLNDNTPISTLHDGMGSFELTPSTRTDKVTFTVNGKSHTFSLPQAIQSGYSMRTETMPGNSSLLVSVTGSGMDIDTLGVTMTCRGTLVHFSMLDMREGSATTRIPLSGISEGVCQITLYDRHGIIYGRRAIYNHTGQKAPRLLYFPDTDKIAPFSPIKLKFELYGTNGLGLRDRFCLSVRDSHCPGTAAGDDLRTALLLSSDIRGLINKPEYYFESDDSAHTAALDLLMMVQGWERYDWELMSGVKAYRETHRMEDSLTLNGWIETPLTRKPMDSIVVTAAVTSWDNQRIERFRYVTGPDGYFGFNLSDFQNTAKMTISANPRHKRLIGTSARIRFERSMRPSVRAYLPQETVLTDASGKITSIKDKSQTTLNTEESNFPTVVDINDGIILPEVDIKDKRIYIDYYTFKAFDVRQDTEMELDMGEYSTNVAGYLIDKGYSIEFDSTGSGDIAYINGHKPYFYVHEATKALNQGLYEAPSFIDTKDIKSIMVFDRVMFETEAMKLSPLLQELRRKQMDFDTPETLLQKEKNRVLMVDIELKEENQRAISSELKNINSRLSTVTGFSDHFDFYSPSYPDGPIRGDVDYRRTLYWNPNVITDREGHAQVEFYNNSYSTSLSITGAGITQNGTPYVLDDSLPDSTCKRNF